MLDKQRLRTFVLGGIAGALAGILLAPKSGKELRGSIASRAGEARERGQETYFDAQERMRERIAEARERPPQRRETRFEGEESAAPSSKLGPEMHDSVLDPKSPVEDPGGTPPDPSPLRDVSRDVTRQKFGEDPEELQRRIQETRSRLRRAQLDVRGAEDTSGNRDG